MGASGGPKGGPVGFLQLFNGALQAHPHYHLLLPEGLWQSDGTFGAASRPVSRFASFFLLNFGRLLRRGDHDPGSGSRHLSAVERRQDMPRRDPAQLGLGGGQALPHPPHRVLRREPAEVAVEAWVP